MKLPIVDKEIQTLARTVLAIIAIVFVIFAFAVLFPTSTASVLISAIAILALYTAFGPTQP